MSPVNLAKLTPDLEEQPTQNSSTKPVETCQLSPRGREIALMHFNHVEQQVSLAATTAGLIVAADALIIGAYVGIIKDYTIFKVFGLWIEGIAFGIGGAFLVAGFLCALFAVFPNVRFASFQYTVENVVFFGWIGKQSFSDYLQTFLRKDAANGKELDKELLYQVWGKSRWLNRMFKFIQLAVLFTIVGTFVIGAVLLFSGYKLPA
ncbi:MAG: DUF5706 domain-containing protein [Caldilineaceae bacterium]